MDLEKGRHLVRLSREILKEYFILKDKDKLEEKFKQELDKLTEIMGIFVTLHSYPRYDLKGCIGFPDPIEPLGKLLLESTLAAMQDPRFPALKEKELNKIVIEISLLTKPELIKVHSSKDYPKQIQIGKDGLIIELEDFHGLLLPIVAVEHKMNPEQFLDNCCIKAGLIPEIWKEGQCNIYKFQTEVFSEVKPNGDVIQKI